MKVQTRNRTGPLGGILLASACSLSACDLKVNLTPYFSGRPLIFDSMTNLTVTGQHISVTQLDFLLSDFALARPDGTWLKLTNAVAFISLREGRRNFQLNDFEPENYERIRFHIGLGRELNHKDPASYPAGHPLNPEVNGLHWGWMGGYVFLALEGNWSQPDGRIGGYSYHLATDPQLMTVELPIPLQVKADCEIALALDVAKIFDGANRIELGANTTSTHSRTNDVLAGQLRENAERAFSIIQSASVSTPLELASEDARVADSRLEVA